MLKTLEITGKNEEEAVSKGLLQLGLERDDVSVEVLQRAKSGFLGIGSVPAKVKITYEVADEPKPVAKPAPAPVPAPAPAAAPAPAPAPAPAAEKKPAPAPKPEKPAKVSAPAEPKAPAAPKAPKAPAPVEVKVAEPVETPAAPAAEAPVEGTDEDQAIIDAITKFQTGLFAHMGVDATPVITKQEDAWLVVLEGQDLGALIGHRGETLDAIQQLTSYAVNRGRGKRVRIHLDAEGYRARREESLGRLARKTAAKVVKYRRNVTLEPMNAYERHVIHTALQDYPGVSTHSVGTEPNRRTVVTYDPNKN